MENFITDLKIDNFKSIKHIEMKPKRINVFVGKPNVGKSNILEAISLLGAGFDGEQWLSNHSFSMKFMESFARFENFYNLFLNNDNSNIIEIQSNKGNAILYYQKIDDNYYFGLGKDIESSDFSITGFDSAKQSGKFYSYGKMDNSGNIQQWGISAILSVKKYDFIQVEEKKSKNAGFLKPPYGENLALILDTHNELTQEVGKIFAEYNYEFAISPSENRVFLQRKLDNYRVNVFPYSLQADTLQRYIFHLAAIASNLHSVLLFEEPEAHNFPPYTVQLADKIINSSENQFFITTHSPYMLTELLEESDKEEIALYVVKYEDNQTVLKEVSSDEISEILNYGADIFINHKAFE